MYSYTYTRNLLNLATAGLARLKKYLAEQSSCQTNQARLTGPAPVLSCPVKPRNFFSFLSFFFLAMVEQYFIFTTQRFSALDRKNSSSHAWACNHTVSWITKLNAF